MIWIILTVLFAVAAIVLYFKDFGVPFWIFSTVMSVIMLICFFAVPIKGYMKVDSTHWIWTVDILTYKQIYESGHTGHKSSRSSAEWAAREALPRDAYEIKIETHSGSETVVDREWKDSDGRTHKETHTEYYYYANYSYTVNRWVKTSEVQSCGRDKEPYEPERPYDITAPDVLGNCKCGTGHSETYTVTGFVNEEIITYNVSKSDWEQIRDNDEFGYTKFRFGDTIWGLQLAK